MQNYRLRWPGHQLDLGRRTVIMGIVNVTPDSFSDGGKFHQIEAAVAHAEQLAADGADIVDIGGESTRPYAKDVDAREELARVLPVIDKLARKITVPISIDTTKAQVAEAALAHGASIINDVGALRMDPLMARVAAAHGVPVVVMHMLGEPRTMQINPTYTDVVAEVRLYLADAIARAQDAGVERGKIIVDPGIGFGKTIEHNLLLIRHLGQLAGLDVPILVGPSRKAFLRKILKNPPHEEPDPDSAQVETGTQAAVAAAVLNGAHIIRVHNVANTRSMLRVLDAIRLNMENVQQQSF